jgi:hypothetical protein
MLIGISGHGHSPETYPGSREAVERGCTFDPIQNRHGEGQIGESGFRLFHPDIDCPLHGFEAAFCLPTASSPQRLRAVGQKQAV